MKARRRMPAAALVRPANGDSFVRKKGAPCRSVEGWCLGLSHGTAREPASCEPISLLDRGVGPGGGYLRDWDEARRISVASRGDACLSGATAPDAAARRIGVSSRSRSLRRYNRGAAGGPCGRASALLGGGVFEPIFVEETWRQRVPDEAGDPQGAPERPGRTQGGPRRRLGARATSQHGARLFEVLRRRGKQDVELWLVELDDTVVAAGLCLYGSRHASYWRGAALAELFGFGRRTCS